MASPNPFHGRDEASRLEAVATAYDPSNPEDEFDPFGGHATRQRLRQRLNGQPAVRAEQSPPASDGQTGARR